MNHRLDDYPELASLSAHLRQIKTSLSADIGKFNSRSTVGGPTAVCRTMLADAIAILVRARDYLLQARGELEAHRESSYAAYESQKKQSPKFAATRAGQSADKAARQAGRDCRSVDGQLIALGALIAKRRAELAQTPTNGVVHAAV